MIYKVSYVTTDADHPGAIANVDKPPKIGEKVNLGKETFEIIEVVELMPPRGEFSFLHATCRAVSD